MFNYKLKQMLIVNTIPVGFPKLRTLYSWPCGPALFPHFQFKLSAGYNFIV
jgi:hypothetical protein